MPASAPAYRGSPSIPTTRNATFASQDKDPNSLLALYRTLVGLRNTHPALHEGQWFQVDAGSSSVFAALRATEGEAVLVILNLSDAPVKDYKLNLATRAAEGATELAAAPGRRKLRDAQGQ